MNPASIRINAVYVISKVHNIYTERECPTPHMLCTNTLRKVMTQQPLTVKVLIKLKSYATLQIRACKVNAGVSGQTFVHLV